MARVSTTKPGSFVIHCFQKMPDRGTIYCSTGFSSSSSPSPSSSSSSSSSNITVLGEPQSPPQLPSTVLCSLIYISTSSRTFS